MLFVGCILYVLYQMTLKPLDVYCVWMCVEGGTGSEGKSIKLINNKAVIKSGELTWCNVVLAVR